jgi:hypothetical protein
LKAIAEWIGESRLSEVDNVLQDVIPKRILYKGEGIGRNLADQLSFLMTRSMINTPLQNAAAMTMGSNHNTIISNTVKDELMLLAWIGAATSAKYLTWASSGVR